MEKEHSLTKLLLSFLLLTLLYSRPILARRMEKIRPCKSLVVYFHDIVYNGKNIDNSTSITVAAPSWSKQYKSFGEVVIFDDPVTLENNLHSPPIGRAQGMYFFDSKVAYTAWLGFSLVLNSTNYKGTLNLVGPDRIENETRDISVVGGTEDFFMARGIGTISTGAEQPPAYFCLRLDIKLYECY